MICYTQEDRLILRNHVNSLVDISSTLKIGVTSGCFDLLHPLHILFLEKCKRYCDYLVVFVDSDELIYKNKNITPIFSQRDRAYMMSHVKEVNGVSVMNSYDYEFKDFVQSFKTIIVFKNSDTIYDKPVETFGAELVIIPDVAVPRSTSEIKDFLCNTR